jgi:HEAT repeat protein
LFLIEDLTQVVKYLLYTVVTLNLVFLIFVLFRRGARNRYYRNKDAARERYRNPLSQFVNGEITTEQAAEALHGASGDAARDAIQERLLASVDPANVEHVSDLFFALGYVDRWARTAFGRSLAAQLKERSRRKEKAAISTGQRQSMWNFVRRARLFSVPRALAVDHLGNLAPEFSQVFVAEALHDPSSQVRRVAVEAIGKNRHPAAIPLLLEELRKAIDGGNDVSLRTTKSALVCYNLEDVPHFVPFLSHPSRRVRFFVVDTLREICEKSSRFAPVSTQGTGSGTTRLGIRREDLGPEVRQVFLTKVVADSFADVRARGAAVIAHFRDAQAADALRKLLADENEFVRLHTVRVCNDVFYSDLVPDIVRCLADNKWRVREAAAQTLNAFGHRGINELYRYFIVAKDRYAAEQITEEIQRTGLIRTILEELSAGGENAGLAQDVCRKMALMGKTTLLTQAVAANIAPEARILLMEALMEAPTNEFLNLLATISKKDTGPVGAKAGSLLRQSAQRGAAPPSRG